MGRGLLLIVALVVVPATAHGEALTIEGALREASVANALLPLARDDVEISRTFVREVRSARFPTISLGGFVNDARPGSGDGTLEAFARGPIYDPSIHPRLRVAQANVAGALGRYRITTADLEFDVRSRFGEVIEADAEIAIQREAIARLTSYVDTVRLRQLAGEGVEADRLTAQAQLETQHAALIDAQLRAIELRMQLNDLLGRDPRSPLVLATPPLAVPFIAVASPWLRTPDVRTAAADLRAATESIGVARAERRPFLSYELAGGLLGVQPPQSADESFGHRILRGFGVSATLTLAWTVFDFGGYRARLARAKLQRDRARANETVVARAARLAFVQAEVEVATLLHAIEVNARAVSASRDAYLAAESVYRGGSGTALAVIDAHRIWVTVAITNANVVFRYRVAEAAFIRRGEP